VKSLGSSSGSGVGGLLRGNHGVSQKCDGCWDARCAGVL